MHEPHATTVVVARDGTRLATDLYLPRRPGRVPAVIARTPYGRASNPVWFPAIGQLFAEHGLAFVAQDTRGHHGSGGELAPFVEAADSWDTFDWVIGQPWSDGTLGVFGESYVGYTAIAGAATGHPALRAAAIRNTSTDIAGDWLRHQGVLRLEFVLRWALAAWWGPENLAPEFDWTRRPMERIVRDLAPGIVHGELPGLLRSWTTGRDHDPLPPDDRWPQLIDRVRVPTHLTTGWWDLFIRGATRDWSRLAARTGIESRLVAEPTDHAGHDWSDGPTPDPLADFEALGARMPIILAPELAFLRRHLLGIDDGPTAPASWTLTHVGLQSSSTWPPPGAVPTVLHLVDGGRARHGPEGGGLSPRPDRVPLDATWRHDPTSPVPALEGEASDGWFHRPDERMTQVRDDVLTFTSEAMREPLDLAGPVVAALVVGAPSAGCHVMAKLCDVYPDGQAHRIADGACAVAGDAAPVHAVVELGDTGYRVRPGHRLRLEVSASAYPRYVLHPGSAADPWTATVLQGVDVSVRTGPGGSSLHLTVQPGADR